MTTSKRLDILKASLRKKELLFHSKLDAHIATVKQANGQPLNDKRNGQATLNKWERQNESLRSLNDSIDKTKRAIENEESKIHSVEATKEILPKQILDLIEDGTLIQWRKHPNTFFVDGVKKARIVWDTKKKFVAHKYSKAITDKEEWSKFAKTFNNLQNSLK